MSQTLYAIFAAAVVLLLGLSHRYGWGAPSPIHAFSPYRQGLGWHSFSGGVYHK